MYVSSMYRECKGIVKLIPYLQPKGFYNFGLLRVEYVNSFTLTSNCTAEKKIGSTLAEQKTVS